MHHGAAGLGGPHRRERGVLLGRPAVLERRRGGLGEQQLRALAGEVAAHVGERRLEAHQRPDAQVLALPLALALPEPYAIAAVVVVTQTLVEVIGMVVYVRAVPRLLPESAEAGRTPTAR